MIAIKIPQYQYVDMRPYSFEIPVGDPHRGPAFGQKEKGFGGILGAVASIAANFVMPGAGFFGGLSMFGSIASGIGMLTGNKFLSKLGMGMSLVGGISSFMTDTAGNMLSMGEWGGEASQFAQTSVGKFLKGGFSADLSLGQIGESAASVAGEANGATGNIMAEIGNTGMLGRTAENMSGTIINGVTDGAQAASSGGGFGGLLKSVLGDKDLLKTGLGALDGMQKQEELDQKQPLIDAQVNSLNQNVSSNQYAIDKDKTRTANLNSQDVGNLPTFNQDANPFTSGTNPGASVKVVTLPDGTVTTTASPDYAQYMAQQQQAQQGVA